MGLKQAAENAITLEMPADLVRVVGNDPVDVELRLHNHGDTTEDFFLTCLPQQVFGIIFELPATTTL